MAQRKKSAQTTQKKAGALTLRNRIVSFVNSLSESSVVVLCLIMRIHVRRKKYYPKSRLNVLNHSCSFNMDNILRGRKGKKKLFLYANRDIQPGEKLTFDYPQRKIYRDK